MNTIDPGEPPIANISETLDVTSFWTAWLSVENAPVEMHSLDGGVRREEHLPARGGKHRRVVPDAAIGKRRAQATDDFELFH